MISDKGAIKIINSVQNHPSLEALLMCGRKITDKSLECLSEAIKERHLYVIKIFIWGSDITEKGVKDTLIAISKTKRLKVIHIGI